MNLFAVYVSAIRIKSWKNDWTKEMAASERECFFLPRCTLHTQHICRISQFRVDPSSKKRSKLNRSCVIRTVRRQIYPAWHTCKQNTYVSTLLRGNNRCYFCLHPRQAATSRITFKNHERFSRTWCYALGIYVECSDGAFRVVTRRPSVKIRSDRASTSGAHVGHRDANYWFLHRTPYAEASSLTNRPGGWKWYARNNRRYSVCLPDANTWYSPRVVMRCEGIHICI